MSQQIHDIDKSSPMRGKVLYQFIDQGTRIELQDKYGNKRVEVLFMEDEIYQREVVRWGWKSR